MKVKFTCCNCNENFNVDATNFKNKVSIVCPNCGTEFPKDNFKDLKDSVLKIQQIKDSLYNKNELGESLPSWHIDFLTSTNGHR